MAVRPFPVRVVLVTLDGHLAAAVDRARESLAGDLSGFELRVHVAADWADVPSQADRCCADLDWADFVICTMLFTEETANVVAPVIAGQRERYDAVLCLMCAPELVRLTRLGKFVMGKAEPAGAWSPAALFRKLRGERGAGKTPGERQLAALKLLPKLLRFLPGVAQDLRTYLLAFQYWLAATDQNLANLIRMLVNRYASGPRAGWRGRLAVGDPEECPECGVYHPDLPNRGMAASAAALPPAGDRARVGVLVGRSYLLAGNTAHYDAVIRGLERRGLAPVPCFASGLDARPALDRFYRDRRGRPTIEALVSLTGFSLVGGPAYNDPEAARVALEGLDVPYLSAQSLEFQTIDGWAADARGLNPLQATLQVAIPELDGAIAPVVFGGTNGGSRGGSAPVPDRVELLVARVARLVRLRQTPRADRKVAVVLFNFPPNAGNTGSAAYLAVFASLQRVLAGMKEQGYTVELPGSVDDLRTRLLEGNASRYGTPANVHALIGVDEHVREERHLEEIEAVWGAAPGKQLTDGGSLFVMGARFGNVFVGIQPAFGWEGDPMRLLFAGGFSPTHAFSAFYRWIDQRFSADVVLHFGTHGALEFMPGKQVGLSAKCWPDRLIGALPNVYLYASNNSSEGTLAKRRGAATLVSYLTPPIANAGLYRDLLDLRQSLERFRQLEPGDRERDQLAGLIQDEAARLDLGPADPRWTGASGAEIESVRHRLAELEQTLIPVGLHTIGEAMGLSARVETLIAMAGAGGVPGELGSLAELAGGDPARIRSAVEATVTRGTVGAGLEALGGSGPDVVRALEAVLRTDRWLAEDTELAGLLRGLDGRFVSPAPGGDLLRTPAVLPTGRNLYGFDPYRVPSAAAMLEGQRRADLLVARYRADHGRAPETVGVVLWGTDTMKSEGAPLGMALGLLGAAPRFDAVGRVAGARLIPLDRLGRPRIDVVATVSGIFRDLLPIQIKVLAEAAALAAEADEPDDMNPVRRHRLELVTSGIGAPAAGLRVFGNADGSYGSNVNLLVESGRWNDEDELAEQFVSRKSYGYAATGRATPQGALYRRLLGWVDVSCQNLDSVELGATDIDQYVEALGGLHRAVERERGGRVPVYLTDHTRGTGAVRTVAEQVALEARTRTLNPKWYEAQLAYGYEGVRNLASRVTTTLGWSATTAEVPGWVYQDVAATFVLDPEMRARLARANPTAAAAMASRLLEATDRGFWRPDASVLDALRQASDALEDRLEGIGA